MYGNCIQAVEDALGFHVDHKVWIDGGDAAEHAHHSRVFGCHGLRGQFGHVSKRPPLGFDLEGLMRLVVRLVPKHHGFNHGSPLCAIPLPGRIDHVWSVLQLPAAANVHFLLWMTDDREARAAEQRFRASPIRDPPIGRGA